MRHLPISIPTQTCFIQTSSASFIIIVIFRPLLLPSDQARVSVSSSVRPFLFFSHKEFIFIVADRDRGREGERTREAEAERASGERATRAFAFYGHPPLSSLKLLLSLSLCPSLSLSALRVPFIWPFHIMEAASNGGVSNGIKGRSPNAPRSERSDRRSQIKSS